ncbi:tyrosine-protein phosphatase [Xanthomonas graminis]|uniref:tyrosine-protein phosphatase n=1 Tax=Xanthomonas graminis TaxID=3390026 RepID=UPI00396A51DE|nr:tyrosine-protein phosphatase [Xanthomonas translucens pv. phleipratensis]
MKANAGLLPIAELLTKLGAINCRDLHKDAGGLSAFPRNRVIRCASLAYLEPGAMCKLARAAPPVLYVDLRTPREVERDGGLGLLEVAGWTFLRLPIDEVALAQPAQIVDYVCKLVDGTLYDLFLRESRSIIISCALGKDRTGLVVARLLALLNYPHTDIVSDYLESNIDLSRSGDRLPYRFRGTQRGYAPVCESPVLKGVISRPAILNLKSY